MSVHSKGRDVDVAPLRQGEVSQYHGFPLNLVHYGPFIYLNLTAI